MVIYQMSPEAQQPPRQRRVSSAADKWAFFLFFVLGAGAIVGLKQFGFHQLVVTLVPVLVLFVYGFGTLALKRFRLREDQTGDNCYYLGFLYTLVSLAFALYLFQTGESGTEAIITNFGIALVTTITGLFLRVFINQFRQDPVEIEREARLELSEAATRLRSELDTIVLDLNSFRRSIQQSFQEALEESSARSAQALEANTKRVEQLSEISAKVIASLDTLTGRISEIEVPTGMISEKLNPVMEDVVASLDQVAVRISEIEVPSDLISNRLEPVLAELAEVTQAVTAQTKADENTIRQVARAVDKALKAGASWEAQLEGLSTKAQAIAATAADLENLPQNISEGLKGITRALTEQNQLFQEVHTAATVSATESEAAFGRISQAAAETLDLVKRYNEALDQEFRQAARNTARVEASLTSMVDALTTRLEPEAAQEPASRPQRASGAAGGT